MAHTLIFSEVLKNAILDGCKTVTRRPIKSACTRSVIKSDQWYWETAFKTMTTLPLPESDCELVIAANPPVLIKASRAFMISQCPHGNAGDLIELATRHADQSVTPFARAELKTIAIELLHDITDQAAIAEGMPPDTPREHFRCIWDGFYHYTPYSWRWNPAVWVLQFAPTEILAEAHR
ncbi:hypothetical protein [Edwardsiella anguillarum]|uniref:Uncharacterized protein n=1 Tax=Edwardsiella anguillarum TaxID=1821960 RepID=A0ABY8S9I5_9GAMM|nr:hypothetical protein [Edwardsiella anguillarum]WHP82414.1 hypothetical protein MQ095_11410 [Edwardsiella anguillarum]WHP86213.1 hypothetical protein MQ088_11415 [Edwardsiella anguillarum]WHP97669.1 hypothetical protein MQ082_11405 [Edwardsiella anguillarum]